MYECMTPTLNEIIRSSIFNKSNPYLLILCKLIYNINSVLLDKVSIIIGQSRTMSPLNKINLHAADCKRLTCNRFVIKNLSKL